MFLPNAVQLLLTSALLAVQAPSTHNPSLPSVSGRNSCFRRFCEVEYGSKSHLVANLSSSNLFLFRGYIFSRIDFQQVLSIIDVFFVFFY